VSILARRTILGVRKWLLYSERQTEREKNNDKERERETRTTGRVLLVRGERRKCPPTTQRHVCVHRVGSRETARCMERKIEVLKEKDTSGCERRYSFLVIVYSTNIGSWREESPVMYDAFPELEKADKR